MMRKKIYFWTSAPAVSPATKLRSLRAPQAIFPSCNGLLHQLLSRSKAEIPAGPRIVRRDFSFHFSLSPSAPGVV
jgi:hypothetical protein